MKKKQSKQIYPNRFLIAFTKEQARKLAQLAQAQQCSQAAVLRELLDETMMSTTAEFRAAVNSGRYTTSD